MCSSQSKNPVMHSILDLDSNNITNPPNFLEYETNQAMRNLNVDSADLVPAPRRKGASSKANSEQKRLETVQKIIDERNRLINTSKPIKKKKLKRRRKCKTRDDENVEANEESPYNYQNNPNISNFQQQSEEPCVQNENQMSVTQPQNSKPKRKCRRRVSKTKKEHQYQQEEETQENVSDQMPITQPQAPNPKRKYRRRVPAIQGDENIQSNPENIEDPTEFENQSIKQYQVHQPQDPSEIQNSSKRFRSKKLKQSKTQKEELENQNQIGENNPTIQSTLTTDSQYNEYSEQSPKKLPPLKGNDLVPNEDARRVKEEELLKKREKYNKLKEKKWKEYLKEQERRKKLLYHSKCNDQVDLFSKRVRMQNQKENENSIKLTSRYNQQSQQQQQQATKPYIKDPVNSIKKQKKAKKRRAKKNNKKKINNVDNNDNARSLVGSAKSRPKVIVPKTMQLSTKKKWNGRSRIPRFVGTQQLSDFY